MGYHGYVQRERSLLKENKASYHIASETNPIFLLSDITLANLSPYLIAGFFIFFLSDIFPFV